MSEKKRGRTQRVEPTRDPFLFFVLSELCHIVGVPSRLVVSARLTVLTVLESGETSSRIRRVVCRTLAKRSGGSL